jgi:hypothetical protein
MSRVICLLFSFFLLPMLTDTQDCLSDSPNRGDQPHRKIMSALPMNNYSPFKMSKMSKTFHFHFHFYYNFSFSCPGQLFISVIYFHFLFSFSLFAFVFHFYFSCLKFNISLPFLGGLLHCQPSVV